MKRNILLVEGQDEFHVISSLCKRRNYPKTFEIEDCKSREKAIDLLEVYFKEEATRTRSVGIVIDAETNNEATWQKIKSRIEKSERYDYIPATLPTNGLILQPNRKIYPQVGVWIMPNNNTAGMLEDFVALLADKDDALMNEVEQTLTSLEKKEINKYKHVHRAKAKIHTFLAWNDEPGYPMGLAITAKVLNGDAKEADLFMEWIARLFPEK